MSLFPGELNGWRQELKICCLQVSPVNILLEFSLYVLEAKEEYILKLSILLTMLWMYHHLLIYINILLLSNRIHWNKHQDYKTTTMTSVLSASNSIFCLGSQILSKLAAIFHTSHFLKFRSIYNFWQKNEDCVLLWYHKNAILYLSPSYLTVWCSILIDIKQETGLLENISCLLGEELYSCLMCGWLETYYMEISLVA